MSIAALAFVDVLFTDDEMAHGKDATRQELRFPPVEQRKIRLSCVRFTKKFDSRFFSEQWNQIAARINTKC